MTEEWRTYQSYYRSGRTRSYFRISNFGNIEECEDNLWNGKPLKITINNRGRRALSNGSGAAIFHLVYKIFVGDKPKGFDLHHIDGNKLNDRLDNLQLLSHSDHLTLHKKGHKYSDEIKKRMSEAAIGRTPWNKGIPHSEETKLKLKEAWKRRRQKINKVK